MKKVSPPTHALTSLLLNKVVRAALQSVKDSLPSEEFVAQLDKLNLLQHRLHIALDRRKVIEVITNRLICIT